MTRWPALQHRTFASFFVGMLVSNIGGWMQTVAQSWLVYTMTGNDPLYLGWLGFSFSLPAIAGPPFGGVLADRFHKARLLIVTQTLQLLLAVALAALTWSGSLRVWHVFAATAAGASLLAVDNPTRQSLFPELVPRKDLANAISVMGSAYPGAALIGPAIAGALMPLVGPTVLFLLNAVSFVAILIPLLPLRKLSLAPRPDAGGFARSFVTGLAYVGRDKATLTLLCLLAFVGVLVRSYREILPVFASQVWRTGPGGYGVMLAAGGAGAVAGSVILSTRRDIKNRSRVLLGAGAATCITLVAFAWSPTIGIASVLLGMSGACTVMFTTVAVTILQLRVPSALRGRVMSLYASIHLGCPSLGALLLGVLARRFRAPEVILVVASACIGVIAVSGHFITKILSRPPLDATPKL